MRSRRQTTHDNFYEIFSDMALLMLAAFVFLFAVILISARLSGSSEGMEQQIQQLMQENARMRADSGDGFIHLQEELQASEARYKELEQQMQRIYQDQSERILESVGLGKGRGKKDFELFVAGLRAIPGHDLHLIVDATGSMHGVTTFLIPVLRVIADRSGKHVSAISWYADYRTGTVHGAMNEMFDKLMQEAPFIGAEESIGHALTEIGNQEKTPGAYLLIGDEPPADKVHYSAIPAPVFTLPLGVDNDADTRYAYKQLAEKTGGQMLTLQFK